MANDETIAALELAAQMLERGRGGPHAALIRALIRAHIETLRNGGERAQIVAYARKREEEWRAKEAEYRSKGNHGPYLGEPRWRDFASAIDAGAHLKGEGHVADD